MILSFGLCLGSYIDDTHHQTNYDQPDEHFGDMKLAPQPSPFSWPQRTFDVDDYGPRDNDESGDNEVT